MYVYVGLNFVYIIWLNSLGTDQSPKVMTKEANI